MKEKYIRIGTSLYKIVQRPLRCIHSEKNGEYTFYHIGIEGELFPMKKKGRYFEINRATVDKILL